MCCRRWLGSTQCRCFRYPHSTSIKARRRRQDGIWRVLASQPPFSWGRASCARSWSDSRSHQFVEREGVAYRLVSDVNAPEFLDQLRQGNAELLISVSCPQIFRRALIELPPRGILNIHGAILPQYRGVMPSFWMMANGERQAGVSIYFVNEKIDAGELCGQERLFIDPKETLDKFILRSKLTSAGLLLRTIDALEGGTIERRPLDLAAGSYFSWPDATAVRRFRACGRRLW